MVRIESRQIRHCSTDATTVKYPTATPHFITYTTKKGFTSHYFHHDYEWGKIQMVRTESRTNMAPMQQ
jgi:hypothetical protein